MAKMAMKAVLKASANAVWQAVGNFGGVRAFIPVVQSCTVEGKGVGAVRTVTLDGGAVVTERLEARDARARILTYSILTSPLPLEGYVSTMRVSELPHDRAELNWSCTFEPKGASEDECKKIVEGVYTAGFAGLKKLLEAQP